MRVAVAALLVAVLVPTLTVGATAATPVQWPGASGAGPALSATPNTIRFSGSDRYQTNLALSLALRGKGDFPFDTSDPTSGNAASLAQAEDWWGPSVCPRSIILVAGDTFIDALAAASLSDPTDRSDQPRLQRVASADATFDPVGAVARVDTAAAPVIVTASGRAGATTLAPTARLAATDLARGGCTTARSAIIVGGASAVPAGVEPELLGLGYTQVFRVAGNDRYETAARIATALGTKPVPTGAGCLDPDTTDGTAKVGFYANSVVEFRPEPDQCRLLSRTVILADGGTGADALAAGWLMAQWQVPLLLTAPDGSLPPATRAALQDLTIDTVIVLGGTARIPESPTIGQVRSLTGAAVGRFAGTDRYATSIDIAKKFGGWWPAKGASFAGDAVCIAGSSGNGANAKGWPDALAAGPFCGSLTASRRHTPVRALAPVTGADAATAGTGGIERPHDVVPTLLVSPGAVPDETRAFLASTYGTSTPCTGDRATACSAPGFAVVVGGVAAVSQGTIDEIGKLIGGDAPTTESQPTANGAFVTALDMAPVFSSGGNGAARRVCFTRGSLAGARWLSVGRRDRSPFTTEYDVLRAGVYLHDADGVVRSKGISAPSCVQFGDRGERALTVAAVAVAGGVSAPIDVDVAPEHASSLSSDVTLDGDVATSEDGPEWTFGGVPGAPVSLQHAGLTTSVSSATLTLNFTLDPTTRFVGSFRLDTAQGPVIGVVTGDAIQVGGRWELRGRSEFSGVPTGAAVGGFRAALAPHDLAWRASWVVDGTNSTNSAGS